MDKRLRIGLVGISASGMPRRLTSCIREQFHDVALGRVWDPDEQAGRAFADTWGLAAAGQMDEVIEDSDLIIMDVKSCHTASYASAVLEAGVALYISKPLANNLAHALDILTAARVSGTPLLSTSAMRYAQGVRQAASTIRQGRPARLQHLSVYLYHPIDEYLSRPETEWHVAPAGGGGPMVYLGVHAVDILDEIRPLEDVEWISSAGSRRRHGDHPIFRSEGVFDTYSVQARFRDGVTADLQVGCGVSFYDYGGWAATENERYAFKAENDYANTVGKLIEMAASRRSPLDLQRMGRIAGFLDMVVRSALEERRIRPREELEQLWTR